jgi:hypothetical protein
VLLDRATQEGLRAEQAITRVDEARPRGARASVRAGAAGAVDVALIEALLAWARRVRPLGLLRVVQRHRGHVEPRLHLVVRVDAVLRWIVGEVDAPTVTDTLRSAADAERVLDIRVEVARRHPAVLREPAGCAPPTSRPEPAALRAAGARGG